MFRFSCLAALFLLACPGVSAGDPARSVSFLGSNATGRSIVIVIDLQAGTHETWRDLCLQTSASLRSLAADQSFNIIVTQTPACLAVSPDTLIPATPGNIDNAVGSMRRWRTTGQHSPIPALELAFGLKPEIIYLLADKDFAGPGSNAVARFCVERSRNGGPKIHTLAFSEYLPGGSSREPSVAKCLRDIARDSGGSFRMADDDLFAETPPDHTLVIRRGVWSNVVGFTPDGKFAYVSATVHQANVWQAIVYYWPEMAAAILGLILIRVLIRAARSRQEPGEQYCRRCGYNVRGLPGEQCPECGTQLTPENRIRGRSRRPRLIVAMCLLVSVVAMYPIVAMRLPRQGGAGQWVDCRSTALAKWAIAGNRQWLLRHTTLDDAVLRVDLDSGSIAGVHCRIQRPHDELFFGRMLSTDGRVLVGSLDDRATQIDCASGRIVRSYPVPCYTARHARLGSHLMFVCEPKQLSAWDIRTGRKINTTPLDENSSIGGVLSVAGHEQVVLLTEEDSDTIVRVWDPQPGVFTQNFRVGSRWCCCDGGRLYATINGKRDLTIEAWDILSGSRLSATPTGQILPRICALTAAGDWIAATADNETFAFNLRTGANRSWQITYPLPEISPDGRHLVAGAFCGSGHFDEVRIHDLPQ